MKLLQIGVVALCVPTLAVLGGTAVAHADLVGFSSPSGNIGCVVDADYVRCDIAERDWSAPARPVDCELDYGQGIAMAPGSPSAFVCAGDTTLHAGPPLAYGQSVSRGSYTCTSAPVEVLCTDTRTGAGFGISRGGYRLY